MMATPAAHWSHVIILFIAHAALPASAFTAHVGRLVGFGGYVCGARHFLFLVLVVELEYTAMEVGGSV